MIDSPTPWNDWYNAEVYNHYVHEFHIYRELNRRLAELAELSQARRVLDLACGSGATAHGCLYRLPANAELVGVDASRPMIEIARAEVRDPRARFEVAAAATIDEVIDGPFDRAVCNTAFWQFPSPLEVLATLARLLERGALFVFNVPAERLAGEPSEVHPFQAALARAIEERTATSYYPTAVMLEREGLCSWLAESGFTLRASERFVYPAAQGELLELMRIPAMISPLTPKLSPEERQSVIDAASRRTDLEERVEVPWVYFVCERR